jgi:hypothetical protein
METERKLNCEVSKPLPNAIPIPYFACDFRIHSAYQHTLSFLNYLKIFFTNCTQSGSALKDVHPFERLETVRTASGS